MAFLRLHTITAAVWPLPPAVRMAVTAATWGHLAVGCDLATAGKITAGNLPRAAAQV
jgi:hypothetical protein